MRWLRVLVIVLVTCLTGCATLPTSGPVTIVQGSDDGFGASGVDVAAKPPAPGAAPQAIVEGFFAACESAADGYEVARAYLTEEAADSWLPESGVRVFDDSSATLESADATIVLDARVVGAVDEERFYTASSPQPLRHDFHLRNVDGEWRIADPGTGILMSTSRFQRTFQPTPIYFYNLDSTRLVAQQVFLRRSELNPVTIVERVLQGPGPWLESSAASALPHDTTTTRAVVSGTIAEVDLSADVVKLDLHERTRAAAQLLASLSRLGGLRGIRLRSGGNVLPLGEADPDGVLAASVVRSLQGKRTAEVETLYASTGDELVRLHPGDGGRDGAIANALRLEEARAMAVSWEGDLFALIGAEGTSLSVASTWFGLNRQEFTSDAPLIDPTFDVNGNVWVAEAGDTPRIWRLDPLGHSTAITLPVSGKIVAFDVSCDLARLVVVIERDSGRQIGVVRLRESDVDRWGPLPLSYGEERINTVRDAVFTSDHTLMVLAGTERATVFRTDIDGAQVESVGPLVDVTADYLIAQDHADGAYVGLVTSEGDVYHLEERNAWTRIAEGIHLAAYPS